MRTGARAPIPPLRPSLVRSALLAVAALAVIGACGSGAEPGVDDSAPDAPTPTSLTITVVTDESADPRVLGLQCDPPGGDHPNADAACAALEAAEGQAALEPVPADQPCTEIYGGPQTAVITGTYRGVDVDASFSRENGCEIDRWDALGTEVFDVPML